MITRTRTVLMLAILAVSFISSSAFASFLDAGTVTPLSWNLHVNEAPFVVKANGTQPGFAGPLIYPADGFALPLSRPLVYSTECDCFSLTVERSSNELELVSLWRAQAGFYRSGRGPYLELEQLDSLKSITALSGTRFLFAQVGDGEWRCVSIHDSRGSYLLIDYRADGLIGQIRDSFARTATPSYRQGRMISLTQSWNTPAGQRVLSVPVQ